MQPPFPNLRIAESVLTFWEIFMQWQLLDQSQPGLFFVAIDPQGANEDEHEAEKVDWDYGWLIVKSLVWLQ